MTSFGFQARRIPRRRQWTRVRHVTALADTGAVEGGLLCDTYMANTKLLIRFEVYCTLSYRIQRCDLRYATTPHFFFLLPTGQHEQLKGTHHEVTSASAYQSVG
jgi:hypothetical protein